MKTAKSVKKIQKKIGSAVNRSIAKLSKGWGVSTELNSNYYLTFLTCNPKYIIF